MSAVLSVVIMAISAFIGFLAGAFLNSPMGGAILFALIAGIACIIRAINHRNA